MQLDAVTERVIAGLPGLHSPIRIRATGWKICAAEQLSARGTPSIEGEAGFGDGISHGDEALFESARNHAVLLTQVAIPHKDMKHPSSEMRSHVDSSQ